jgi:hypothetical protein
MAPAVRVTDGRTDDTPRPRGDIVCGCEVPAMSEGQSDRSGQLCAIRARPEQPYVGHGPLAWNCGDAAVGMTFRKLAPEKRQKLGEQRRIVLISAPECVRRDLVSPGRPAPTQVDPAGVQLLKHPELLDNRERRVVRKHYATGADAQARGSRSHVRDQDRWRGAGQPRHVVVLGHPITLIADLFGELGQPRGMPEGIA